MKKLKDFIKSTWGGKCLSTSIDKKDPDQVLVFRCKKGHEFERSVSEVYQGYFCDSCKCDNSMKFISNTTFQGSGIAKNVIDTVAYGIGSLCEIVKVNKKDDKGEPKDNKKIAPKGEIDLYKQRYGMIQQSMPVNILYKYDPISHAFIPIYQPQPQIVYTDDEGEGAKEDEEEEGEDDKEYDENILLKLTPKTNQK